MGLSCLVDRSEAVVIDASTAINLNASGFAEDIFRALPHDVVVTDVVLEELQDDASKGRRDRLLTESLVKRGLLSVVRIAELPGTDFEELVIGRGPETLDDGEAATIACASATGAIAILDERKGRRICAARYPLIPVGCTGDLFTHPAVGSALGPTRLAAAVFTALKEARMRILERHGQWVIELIGLERADECPSLRRLIQVYRAGMAKQKAS